MLVSKVKQFLSNETGATAIEYGLIAAGLSIAVAGAVQLLGTSNSDMYDYISAEVSASVNS